MAQLVKTILNVQTVDAATPTTTYPNTLHCGLRLGVDERRWAFVNFDPINDELPANAKIDSAYLELTQVAGGTTGTLNYRVILYSGSWQVINWDNRDAFGETEAPVASASLAATSAGTRSVNVTSLIQWLVANGSSAHILGILRYPFAWTGGMDIKRFSGTASAHRLVINYTLPPNAPTIGTAARVSDTRSLVTWTRNITSDRPYATQLVERQTNGGAWAQVAEIAGGTGSYTDTTVQANRYYAYRVRGKNSAGTSAASAVSNTVYNTPAAPGTPTATKTGTSTATVAWADNSATESNFRIARSVDGGAWSNVGTVGANVTSWPDPSVPAGSVRYRVQAYRGSLESAWSGQSNAIIANAPPAAPTILNPWGPYMLALSTLTISWRHNSIDGSAQTAAQVDYSFDGGDNWTTETITGATDHYDIDISSRLPGDVIQARVRTKGVHASYGADSAVQQTTLANLPQAVITTPATDGATVTDAPLVVAWDYSDDYQQAAWTLNLYNLDGALLRTWQGTTETIKSIGVVDLPDGGQYHLVLKVFSGTGFAGTAEREFATDYDAPTVPSVYATFDPERLSTEVVGYAGETGALPATDHLLLYRVETFRGQTYTESLTGYDEDGGALPYAEGSAVFDLLPRLGQAVIYRLFAVAANGAASNADAPVDTRQTGTSALNFADAEGAERLLRVQYDQTIARSVERQVEVRQFAERDLPVEFRGRGRRPVWNVTAILLDEEQREALAALETASGLITFRDPRGYRCHVSVPSLADSAKNNVVTDVSLPLTEVE